MGLLNNEKKFIQKINRMLDSPRNRPTTAVSAELYDAEAAIEP